MELFGTTRRSRYGRFLLLFCLAAAETPVILVTAAITLFVIDPGGSIRVGDFVLAFYGTIATSIYVISSNLLVGLLLLHYQGSEPLWILVGLLQFVLLLAGVPLLLFEL